MSFCLFVIIAANCLADVVMSVVRNASALVESCIPLGNATDGSGVPICKPNTEARGRRGHDEEPSYNMVIQAAYGLTAITILVVAYFVFRTMRFVFVVAWSKWSWKFITTSIQDMLQY